MEAQCLGGKRALFKVGFAALDGDDLRAVQCEFNSTMSLEAREIQHAKLLKRLARDVRNNGRYLFVWSLSQSPWSHR